MTDLPRPRPHERYDPRLKPKYKAYLAARQQRRAEIVEFRANLANQLEPRMAAMKALIHGERKKITEAKKTIASLKARIREFKDRIRYSDPPSPATPVPT